VSRLAILTLLSFLGAGGLARPCDTFGDPKQRAAVDLAPPAGYVDVCSRDAQLCRRLTEGYPPSVQTLAYFVLAEEWQLHERGALKGFTQYLIAQRAVRPYSTEAFADLKRSMRESQGDIPDSSVSGQAVQRRSLGVIDEAGDLIAIGMLMRRPGLAMASINAGLRLKKETLILYIFRVARNIGDVNSAKALAREWVSCIRSRNSG
jgi:hypothetical protein